MPATVKNIRYWGVMQSCPKIRLNGCAFQFLIEYCRLWQGFYEGYGCRTPRLTNKCMSTVTFSSGPLLSSISNYLTFVWDPIKDSFLPPFAPSKKCLHSSGLYFSLHEISLYSSPSSAKPHTCSAPCFIFPHVETPKLVCLLCFLFWFSVVLSSEFLIVHRNPQPKALQE